jgi:hypothetical protein
MPSAGFESATPATKRPETYALDRAATEVGIIFFQQIFYFRVKSTVRRLGGVVVSVMVSGPKRCGFKTRPRRWIFKGDKYPQHTFLSDGK